MSFELDSTVLQTLFERPQFSIPQEEKELLLFDSLLKLQHHHMNNCAAYNSILSAINQKTPKEISDFPPLPVSLFKSHELMSIDKADLFKTMTSSGTTGQTPSQIYLDVQTATLQSKALASIVRELIGPKRLPMIIIDTPNVVKDRVFFSARGAGVLGMLPFGRDHFYALNDEMELDIPGLQDFLRKHQSQPFLMFGFTFMVWKYFYSTLVSTNKDWDLSNGTLIHSGGWKKLQDEAVSNKDFKKAFTESTGLSNIHNFYGMVEQVGSIFVEGEDGFLYPPNFADVIVRDPVTWEPAQIGELGVIEVLSVLPRSYPGNVLLTEDVGIFHGISSQQNKWQGKRFEVIGRLPKSELRGCSDTHSSRGD